MEKFQNVSTFKATCQFISGAYFATFFITLLMLLKNLHGTLHPYVLIILFFLYTLLILSYIFIHKKKHNLTLSALVLFWIITAINVSNFLFQPINEALFLFALIPIILFIAIRDKRVLLINGVLFYIVLIATILYNLYFIKSDIDSEFFIIFTFFNILMILFGIFYQKSMHRLIKSLEESNKINSFLLKETHHRVKNNLNLLSSILALQLDLNNPKDRDFFFSNQQRIESIAKLHEILYTKDTLSNKNLEEYIEEIINLIQKESPKKIEYQLIIKQETLNLDTLLYIGIIITEVLLNSIKYNPNSKIELFFNFTKNSKYLLKICENSSLDLNVIQKSFGFELLNMAAKNLYGTFKLIQEGNRTCYFIEFPIKVDDV